MNILFIASSFPGRIMEYLVLPSLELCICSSILKSKGHQVELLDMKIDQLTAEDLERPLSEKVADVVLIDDSPETHFTTKKVIRCVRKQYGNNVKIVLRGEIGSFIPREILERNPDLDFIVRFDDDYAFPNIIDQLATGENEFGKINNIAFRDNQDIVVTPTCNRTYELNNLPYPDRKIYNIDKYLLRDSETIVRSTRGCPGHCLFCIKTRFSEFGTFSVQRFCDEIEELLSMGFKSFFFSDDTFAFSDARVKEFADEVKRRKLKLRFTSNIRIKDINDYKIRTLKEVGAYRFFVGIETINAQSSDIINKNLSENEIKLKIALLKKYGIEYHASFILGAPNDTEADLFATAQFLKEIQPTIVTFNMIKAYPGLPLYTDPQKYEIIMDDPYWFESDLWTKRCVIGTKNLPPEKIEKWARFMLFSFMNSR